MAEVSDMRNAKRWTGGLWICLLLLLASMGIQHAGADTTLKPGGETVSPIPVGRAVPSPDLKVMFDYKFSSCALDGKYSRYAIWATVTNAGPGPAAATHGIKIKAYPSVALLPIDPKYSTMIAPVVYGSKLLNAGESFVAKMDLALGPATTNGPYEVVVQVDPDNEIKETNETNNLSSLTVPAVKSACTKK